MKKIGCWILSCIMVCSFVMNCFTLETEATDLSAFPESYRPYIQKMQEEHPNWEFVAYNTGVTWKALCNYEFGIGINLIEKSAGEEWLSRAEGCYDPVTGEYKPQSGSIWMQPSDEAISYYMDPRNFLNSTDVFMFKKFAYNPEYHTEQSVEQIIRTSWMHNRLLEDDPTMTYAQAFIKIGSELGISPFMLASRVNQEQGQGNSPLISGTYEGYEGYYNYFNIQAYGSTQAEIYRRGLEEAKKYGWDSRYKSLYGGSEQISKNYISRGQDTLYFQKFDVVKGLSWRQYMQNLRAPLHEGQRIRKGYDSCGLLESSFVFVIPVYTGMPTTACPKPSLETMPVTLGDVNDNGIINAEDALLVLQHAAGIEKLSGRPLKAADMNGDSLVNAEDALKILERAANIN